MNFCDTHCHIFHEYYDNIDLIFDEAKLQGVNNFILSGCSMNSNQEILKTLDAHRDLLGVIGLHPEEADNYSKQDILEIEKSICHKGIIGIGEIGLDYHYTKENKEKQKTLFRLQLELAEKYNLPVVIHSREATEDIIEILKNYSVKGVIHSFSGSLETAKIYISLGYCLGINGVVTFKNSKLRELLPFIKDHFILETDSPYLTPHPYRGQKNEPKYIRNIAEFIASELDISIRQVEKVTNRNIERIFDISLSL